MTSFWFCLWLVLHFLALSCLPFASTTFSYSVFWTWRGYWWWLCLCSHQ